ncbi:hypothetical protein Rsub_02420 [Raphidocelis subcapitata]|uniref:BZIP domain-containing protein n=1 Tax=Raphidocelis subcapitata TaxID=307507 RepID=A0A2V0NRQ4_9CHLO|nr:hypothetical protein Rsub_02420 [Raphidocelis subcapitata]|eukprot:GBF90314.1 hypothetical protein Rsub_02420 [Raphidocelis subcapitata]
MLRAGSAGLAPAIPLNFDPGLLLQDAETLLEDSGFDSWLVRNIGDHPDDDAAISFSETGSLAAAAAPAAAPAPAPRASAVGGFGPSEPAGPSGGGGGGEVGSEQLLRVPPGHRLVEVEPGLYAVRPAAATDAAANGGFMNGAAARAAGPPAPAAPPLALPKQAEAPRSTGGQAWLLRLQGGQRSLSQQVGLLQETAMQQLQRTGGEPEPLEVADPVLAEAQAQLRVNSAGSLQAGAPSQATGPAPGASGGGGAAGAGTSSGASGEHAAHHAKASAHRRASSQRFRERQKELISELESEVVQKVEQMELLSQENQLLKLRTRVLESAVEGRDEQLKIMKDYGVSWRCFDDSQPRRSSCGGGAAQPGAAGSPDSGAAEDSVCGTAGGRGGNGGGAAAAAQTDSGSEHRSAACGGGGGATASWIGERVPTIEEIKNMSPEETRLLWRTFLHHAARELVVLQGEELSHSNGAADAVPAAAAAAAPAPRTSPFVVAALDAAAVGMQLPEPGGGGNGNGSAGEAAPQPSFGPRPLPPGTPVDGAVARIHGLVGTYLTVIKHVMLLNPTAAYPLYGINLDTGLPQPTPDSYWRNVVAQLALTPAQVQDFLAIHELYAYHANRVLAERAVLQMRLGSAGPAASPTLTHMLNTTVAMQTTEALAANMKKEHALKLLLECFCYGRVLTPVQLARAAVFSYPLLPDITTMVSVCCEDAASSSPNGARRLIFAHHAQHMRESAVAAAQKRVIQTLSELGAGATAPGGA